MVGGLACLLTLLLLPMLSGKMVLGQQSGGAEENYDVIPIDDEYVIPDTAGMTREQRRAVFEKASQLRRVASQVRSMLRGESPLNTAVLDKYIKNEYFAKMTQTGPEEVKNYGQLRADFFKRTMAYASGAVRNHLVEQAFNTMRAVAQGNFHPAARVNALLLIGSLDSRRGDRRSAVPVPYAPALDYLKSKLSDSDTPLVEKIAAMDGIKRHAKLRGVGTPNALPNNEIGSLASLLVSLLTAAEPEDAKLADGAYWMRRQAAQALGGLRFPGNGVASALRTIIENQQVPWMLRLDAVAAFEKLQFANANEADVMEVIKAIASFVIDATRRDANYIENSIQQIIETAKFLDGMDLTTGKKDVKKQMTADRMDFLFGNEPDSNSEDANTVPEILPVFQRQIVRQRVKTILYYSYVCVKKLRPLVESQYSTGSAELGFTDAVIRELESIMNGTNIVDNRGNSLIPEPENEGGKRYNRAEWLQKQLAEGADRLEAELAKIEPASGSAGDVSSSASVDAGSRGGN